MTRKHLLPGLALLLAASALSAAPADQESEHIVESGETLGGIANRAKVSRKSIIDANGLKAPYMIRIGQKLKIPRGGKTASRSISSRGSGSSGGNASYTVKPGDTLGGIANREKVPRVLIAEANRLKSPYKLRVGQKLLIPRTRHHIVKAGETGFAISMDYAVPWKNIAVSNGISEDTPLKTGQKLLIPTVLSAPSSGSPTSTATASSSSKFAWPIKGPVRRKFQTRGASSYHDGIDIVADKGAAVRAAAAGTVVFAQKESRQFGNLVIIDHGGGWHSAYGSLDRITVKKGDKASMGERVGMVGDTSITRKTELHFELRKNGKPVDPMTQLP